MANVKVIRAKDPQHPQQMIYISGLSNPASAYSNFRTQIRVNGIVKSERNWTYYSSGTSAEFYDGNTVSVVPGDTFEVYAWATYNGVEYFIGNSVISYTYNFQYNNDPQAPDPYDVYFTIRNLGADFNQNNYICAGWNYNGVIEGSTVMPSMLVRYDAPPSGIDRTVIAPFPSQTNYSGQMIYGFVQAANGRWYNTGFHIVKQM